MIKKLNTVSAHKLWGDHSNNEYSYTLKCHIIFLHVCGVNGTVVIQSSFIFGLYLGF